MTTTDRPEFVQPVLLGLNRMAWPDDELPFHVNHCAPVAFATAANLNADGLRRLIQAAREIDLLNEAGEASDSFEQWADITKQIAGRDFTYGRTVQRFTPLSEFTQQEAAKGTWIVSGSVFGSPLAVDHVIAVIDGKPWGYVPFTFAVHEAREVRTA